MGASMCAVLSDVVGARASPEGVKTTGWVLPNTGLPVVTLVLMAAAAPCWMAVPMRVSAAEAGKGLLVEAEGATPAAARNSCDCVAVLEAKGLSSSGVAGVAVLSPKPLPESPLMLLLGLMGTCWMASQVSSRPEASLEELLVPMDAAVVMISCFSCNPRPWLVVVVMGQPFARNLQGVVGASVLSL